LSQNFPNPFNSSTRFKLHLPAASEVAVRIYNILGQEVAEIFNGQLSAGPHTLEWDGLANDLRFTPSGIYFYRVLAGNITEIRKMVLLK
jgi:flagellar hook assembly protein FlgD